MRVEELQRIYRCEEYYWGTEPSQLAERALEYVSDSNGLVAVDVGAGEGRDSVFFAEHGVDVLAVDVASNGLEKAERLAGERDVRIRTRVGDVNNLELQERVDLFYSIGTIQYLRPENRPGQFAHFKSQTAPGGEPHQHAAEQYVFRKPAE